MLFGTLTLAASLLGLTSAAAINKRETIETSLYAYGTNISGFEVFYGNGLAYLGLARPTWLTASNITFNIDGSSTTTPWTINSNSSLFADGAYELYITPTTNTYTSVGFTAVNGTAPTGAVTDSFGLFGTSVAYVESDSNWELMFWAALTNTTGLWELGWKNGVVEMPSTSTPVTLKITPPTTQSRTPSTVTSS